MKNPSPAKFRFCLHRLPALRGLFLPAIGVASLGITLNTLASERDTIGHTDLLAREPGLDGSNLRIAIAEASTSGTIERYQPVPGGASQPASKFSFFDTASTYPLAGSFDVNKESSHANIVANHFFDANTGLATDVSEIFVFNANNYFNEIILGNVDTNTKVVNQSFIFNGGTQNALIERIYDNYAANHNTLFVNGVNNGSSTIAVPPASAYNGIAVGREDLDHSQNPADNRSKPEIIAPGSAASYATPYVSGAAVLLQEAALAPLEHGGAGTANAASDYRTLKALLLNGAVKDFSWSHTDTHPLDTRRGAGLLNVDHSHRQLQGGKHTPTASANISPSSSYLPSSSQSGNVSSRIGWNFSTITNVPFFDRVDNYYFEIPAATSTLYDLKATLVWQRQNGQTNINNLDFVLYSVNTGAVVVVEQSISTVDNVEHIYKRDLAAGRYVLQVIKRNSGSVSLAEDYAIAFEYAVPAPDAPDSLAATAQPYSVVDLTWSDNSSDELNFELQRSPLAGRLFTTIATLPANTTSYTDTAPQEATTYYYRVKATNANGDSFYTNVGQATTFSALMNWRQTHFGSSADSGDAANDADPDDDGVKNLTEYALGKDPKSGEGADGAFAQPIASIIDITGTDYLQITVTRVENKADIDYIVEVTDDLTSAWVAATTILENTATTLRVRDNVPVTGNNRRFIRLRVAEK